MESFVFQYESPIGVLQIFGENEIVYQISRVEKQKTLTRVNPNLRVQWEQAFSLYFSGHPVSWPAHRAHGTKFQLLVWKIMCKIPFGKTNSYGSIAQEIGNPQAVRAVGGACSKNPLLIVFPCHRVLSKSKRLTGFAAGMDAKKKLLDLEKAAYF